MSKRTLIEIDQTLCDGCGACATGCPEGALKIIEGKARLVGDSLCDGLGACIGTCPKGAIHVIEREAQEYDEVAVLKGILPQGPAVLEAHFAHLDHYGQDLYLDKAAGFLRSMGIGIPQGFERFGQKKTPAAVIASPMATPMAAPIDPAQAFPDRPSEESRLKNWPIQLHLVNPRAAHFAGAHVVVAADCTAFALGSFHSDIIADRALVIACPKLDSGKDLYVTKLASIMAQAASVTVVMMEVPCCSGLLRLVQEARLTGGSSMPIQTIVVGIDGGFVARNTV
jgi:NAD-dependent dihydropyrimidine dehydrogenase PreA subunit